MRIKVLTLLFWTFLISSKLFACDCKDFKSLKEIQNKEFKESKYIFIGKILKIDFKKHTFKIKVMESFKGVLKGKVYNGIYDQWCGPIIDKFGNWLIYANRNSKNLIQIRHCGLTRSFKNPENNISSIRIANPPTLNQSKSQNIEVHSNIKIRAKANLENEIIQLRQKIK